MFTLAVGAFALFVAAAAAMLRRMSRELDAIGSPGEAITGTISTGVE